MKKAIKLTSQQLRQIIMKEARLNEMPGGPRRGSKMNKQARDLLNIIVDSATSAVVEHFEGMYNEGDPSMSALGQEAWNRQVQLASSRVHDAIMGALEPDIYQVVSVEDDLINGEFN